MQPNISLIIALVTLAVSGCAGIHETPLAPNMVRLDVNPPSAPGGFEDVFRYAAELTLRNGYSAFRLTPIYAQAFNYFGVTVVMFHTQRRGRVRCRRGAQSSFLLT